jgi:DNA-binding GntR family transcriptional regulator
LSGDLKPDQRLQEKEISSRFKVSSTPVREACLNLAAEGYLQINTRREVVVRANTLAEVRDLYEIVRILDLHAVKKYIHCFSEKEIRELKAMTERLAQFRKKRNSQAYLQQNLKIHDKIWQACHNKILYEMLVGLMEKISIYRMHSDFAPYSDPLVLEKSFSDHLNLLKGIENKDIALLEKVISSHWGEEFIDPSRLPSTSKPLESP